MCLYFSFGLYVVMGLHTRGDTSVGAPVGYYIDEITSVSIMILKDNIKQQKWYIHYIQDDEQKGQNQCLLIQMYFMQLEIPNINFVSIMIIPDLTQKSIFCICVWHFNIIDYLFNKLNPIDLLIDLQPVSNVTYIIINFSQNKSSQHGLS